MLVSYSESLQINYESPYCACQAVQNGVLYGPYREEYLTSLLYRPAVWPLRERPSYDGLSCKRLSCGR